MTEEYKGEVNIETEFGTDSEEFKAYVGRYPKNERELNDYAHYLKKGMESQLDWDIINQCASDFFKNNEEEEEDE